MIKTKITETTEKFDKDGKLIERITREEETEDNSIFDQGLLCPSAPTATWTNAPIQHGNIATYKICKKDGSKCLETNPCETCPIK
jgi:hypothetical protein